MHHNHQKPIRLDFLSAARIHGMAAALLFAAVTPAAAQTMVGTDPVKILILAGESNMHGKGTVSPVTTQGTLDYIVANDPTGRYQFLKSGGSYVTRTDVGIRGLVYSGAPNPGNLTVNYGGFATGLIGPELGFGHRMGDAYQNKVLIVKVGVDGTTLAGSFCPPSSRVGEPEPVVSTDKGFYYKEIIRLVNDAKTSLGATPYEIAGFGWHQGWNDRVTPAYSAAYEVNMANFINDIRSSDKGLGVPNMPFVIASAAMDPGISYSEVELAQLKMANPTAYPAFAGNVATVDTRTNYEDLEFWQSVAKSPANEGYHWNRSGKTFLHIGMAMGDAMSLIATNRIPCRLRSTGGPGGTTLTWKNGTETPTSVRVLRNGVEIAATAPVNSASFVDVSAPLGVSNYELQFTMPGNPATPLTISHNSGVTHLTALVKVNGAHLSWQNNLSYAGLTVKRDGVVIAASLPGSTTSYVDILPPSGVLSYTVEPTTAGSTPAQVSLKISAYPAQTALIYEPFDMTAAALLEGQTGGLGLDGDWVGSGSLGLTAGNLAFGTLPTFGNRLLRGGGSGPGFINTGTTLTDAGLLADGAVLWFSFLHREPDGNINTQPALILGDGNLEGFNDISGTSSGIGLRIGAGKNPQPILFNTGVYSEGAVQSTIGTSQVALIVGKITWGATPSDPDTIQIYTPGTDLVLDTPTSHSAVLDQSKFKLISMCGNGGSPEFDEIRFGAAYVDVTGQGVNTSGDLTPPTPSTMSFSTPPVATSQTAVTMAATTASDVNGVQYFFDETSNNPGGTDSGWQDSPVYTDIGLNPSTQYTYTVQARDRSVNTNTNMVSSSASATTLAPDTTAPSPNPMTWAEPPDATSTSSITMTASPASDVSGVEYFFDETSGNSGGTDSGWQDSPIYTDTGLNYSTTYTYQVKARDKATLPNETGFSSPLAQATTFSPETTPPSPNPMTWAAPPAAVNSTTISMTATTATDASGVEYFFDETSGNSGGSDSGWQDSPTYTDSGLSPSTVYTYQVKARDKSPLANQTDPSTPAQANTLVAPRLLYWDTNGATAGSGTATGTWDGSTALWSTNSGGTIVPDVAATTYADDLFFSAGTNGTTGTVTISGTQAAHSIAFEEGAITLSGGTLNLGSATAGSGLSFNNVVGYNMNTPIILNSAATDITLRVLGNQGVTYGATGTITGSSSGLQTITIGGPGSGGGPSTFNGIISNGGGGNTVALTVDAASTTTLAAANAYTGATNIIRGTLSIGNASTFSNTSVINLTSNTRLDVNAADSTLAKLATAGGGSGVIEGSFLRYSKAQTAAGAGNGPGTIFGTVELNLTNVNPNYTLDFGARGALTNVLAGAVIYTSPLTLSGTASIDASPANATHTATYSTGGITASTVGAKTLNLTGSNTGANTISSAIGNGSGTIALTKGGGGSWVLSGTNTYTGNTRVDAGTLQFTNQVSLYNNGAAATWTKDNIIVGNGATLAFNIGGAGQFTKANINTLLALSDSASNGFTSGSNVGLDTTGGSLLFDSVIANTFGGSNVLGLTKLGTGTLTLDQANTYTGRTLISGGTLELGDGGSDGSLSTSSTIINNGTLKINRDNAVAQGTDFSAAPITGTGAFIQVGPGTTTLSAANTFSGTTTVSNGVLNLTNALALQNSALVTTGTGTVIFTGFTTPVLGGLSGATGDLSTVIPGFGSTTTLSLNATAGSFTYGGIISDGAGAMTLTKNGASTQILSGANTYTGDTFVNGGVLTVGSGANGSLNSSSTLQMGGGIFNYSRTGAGQTVDGLTVNAGNSTVNNTSSGQTLTLGAITRTGSVYGTVNFATLTGSINTSTANTNGILGPWATTGSTTTLKYAVGAGNISGLTGTTATAGTLANVTVATDNYDYTGAATTAADLTANTLRFSGTAATTAIGATNTLTLNGLMNASSSNTYTISGGPSTGGIIIGSTNELVVAANAQATTISSVIKDGGSAGRLIYSGGGALTLSGLNTFSGGLVINSGIVNTAAAASLSSGGTGTGPITVQGAGTLELNSGVGTLDRALTLNGGRLYFNGSGGNLTVAGTIAFGANSTIDAPNTNSGFPIITANTSGAGGFTKTNVGGLRLNGTSNNYSGPTVVSGGGLTVKSSLYGNVTSNWTPANITVASGATLMLNVAGAGEFTIANAATMFSQLSANVNNNGLLAGSTVGVDTRNATAGTYTYSAVITNSTGAGGGAVNFKHTGGENATILELTGANTYSGTTIVDNGSTLKVSSFNSVFTNAALGTVHTASSSLGAPTTVANGIIHLGSGNSPSNIGNTFKGGSLTYTGTGETTDRIISLNGGGSGDTYRFDQSGTGHLKFLSSFIMGDGRGSKNIILQGSTAGTGEIAGQIPNAATNLTKSGTGTWTLSGANLYVGVTTVSAGALFINGNQSAANGVVNVSALATLGGTGTIGGSTTIANTGKLEFNLSTAAVSHDRLELSTGKTLTFSGASTLTITSTAGASPGLYTLIAGGNNIAGAAPATVVLPDGWTSDPPVIVGNELRLNITSTGGSAYDAWKAANAPGSNPDDDADGDGVENAVEFVLGGTSTTKDLAKLPAVSTSGSDMLFTFYRAQSSIGPKTSTTIEVGTSLITWPSPYAVPDLAATNNPGVTVEKNNPAVGTDKITLRVPKAPDARKFARLKVAITP